MCTRGGGDHDLFRVLDALPVLSEVGGFRSRVLSRVLTVIGNYTLHAALVLRRTTAVVNDNVNSIYEVFGYKEHSIYWYEFHNLQVARFVR